MIGIYFSGTGNTRHAVQRFVKETDSTAQCFSIEEKITAELAENDLIVFGFPIYYSHMPKIVRDYIEENKELFAGKRVFIIATRGIFNAYGIIFAAKRFKKFGANVVGSLQLNMPENIRDMKIMKLVFDYRKDTRSIEKADIRIEKAARRFTLGRRVRSGQGFFNYVTSGFLAILPFYPKTDRYKKLPKIDFGKCVGCGVCAKVCPKQNLVIESDKAVAGENCTVCYRCFSKCPTQAITILGKKVSCQYSLDEK